MTIADKALLVQLQISQWTGRKKDKRVTEDAAKSNNADISAGNYNKSLMAGTDALKKVHQYSSLLRTWYYDNTLAWGIKGTQLLPSKNYLDFNTEYRNHKVRWERNVDDFCNEFEHHKQVAQHFLGSMYNDEDYPTGNELRRKFCLDIATFPVPTTDFRVQVGEQELQRIQREVELRVGNAAEQAMSDLWQRLYDRVEHLTDKLADPGAIFRDTTFDLTRELCDILPKLNFNDDPDLENMRQQVESKLLGHEPDSLRYDLDLRNAKAKEAQDIMDKMSVFMGGAKI